MVCMDGVYLSHVNESVSIPEQETVDRYLPPYDPEFRHSGYTYKLYANYPPEELGYRTTRFDDYMKARWLQHKAEGQAVETTLRANEEFEALFGRGYLPVEEYRCEDAEIVVVISGSAVGTCRAVIDTVREQGHRVGMVKLKMFRP